MDKFRNKGVVADMEQGAVKDNKLLRLFLSTLYISAFTFGGGFVIVTFMKKKFVDELHWIGEEEMMDYIALAQSSPGAISVNAAILVGWKIGNFPGMMIAVLGTIIPPVVILSVLSFFYNFFRFKCLYCAASRRNAGRGGGGDFECCAGFVFRCRKSTQAVLLDFYDLCFPGLFFLPD